MADAIKIVSTWDLVSPTARAITDISRMVLRALLSMHALKAMAAAIRLVATRVLGITHVLAIQYNTRLHQMAKAASQSTTVSHRMAAVTKRVFTLDQQLVTVAAQLGIQPATQRAHPSITAFPIMVDAARTVDMRGLVHPTARATSDTQSTWPQNHATRSTCA